LRLGKLILAYSCYEFELIYVRIYMSEFVYLWNGKFEFKFRLYVWFVESCIGMKWYGWMWMWNCETDLGKMVRNGYLVWAIWSLKKLSNELDWKRKEVEKPNWANYTSQISYFFLFIRWRWVPDTCRWMPLWNGQVRGSKRPKHWTPICTDGCSLHIEFQWSKLLATTLWPLSDPFDSGSCKTPFSFKIYKFSP